MDAADLRGLGAVDVAAEDLIGQLIETAHEAGAAGKKNSRADRVDRSLGQLAQHQAQSFFQALADRFVEHGAAHLDFGETAIVVEARGPDRFRRITRGIALSDLELLSFGKRQARDEVNVVGHMIAANRNAARSGDHAAEVERVIGRAATDVDDQGAIFAVLAVERHLRGGNRRKDDVVDLERHFPDELDAVLDARADAMDDMEIRLHGFAKEPHRRGRVLQPIEPVVADDRVDVNMVGRDVDLAGNRAILFDMLGADDRFAIRQTVGAAVVHALDVRAGDRQINAADFHIGGVLGLGQRVAQAGAGLRVIEDLTLAHAGTFCLADAENLDRAVGLDLADHETGLAGADFDSDMNFATSSHGCAGE